MHNKHDDDSLGVHDPRGPASQVMPSKLLRNCISINDPDFTLYVLHYLVIVAYSLDADIVVFNFLYLYFYNAYFSIIVFKLAQKILQKYKQSLYYKYYRYTLIAVFAIYTVLVFTALLYRIIWAQTDCFGTHQFIKSCLFSSPILSVSQLLYSSYALESNTSNGSNR